MNDPAGDNPGSDGPQIDVFATSVQPLAVPGQWDVTWTVRNRDPLAIQVHEAWLPHGRFRSARRSYEPPFTIATSGEAQLSFAVACQEEPGAVVENSFVILNVTWRDEPWRIFVRLRVPIGEDRVPAPDTEVISAQQVRFDG